MMKAAGETPLAKVQWQHFASGLSRKRQARGGGQANERGSWLYHL